jgi:hypothetical protein
MLSAIAQGKGRNMKTTSSMRRGVLVGGVVLLLVLTVGGRAAAQTCVPPPSGIVSWWPGDGNADDIVGGNDGTLVNGATFAQGMVGQAFSFDGSNDIVIAPDTGLPGGASPRTVALWVKVYPGQDHGNAFGYDGEYEGGGFLIFPVTNCFNGRLGFSGHGSGYNLGTYVDLRDSEYHHVAVTYDNGRIVRIFADGLPVASGYISLNTGSSGFVGIGGRVYMAEFLHGDVDEVAVWNRVLSESEIQAIFAAGSAGMCKTITIQIDIKPGSYPNCFNINSHGVIPVAILGTADFDVMHIDVSSLDFAGLDVRVKGNGAPQCSVEDVTGDGYSDLVCQFVDDSTNWTPEDGYATLTGNLLDGTPISGTDEICIVP